MQSKSDRPKIVVFASGTRDGGGSGFEQLVRATQGDTPVLRADIVAVVSNHQHGGVRTRAERLHVPFIFFGEPWISERYQEIITQTDGEWVALSGWLKKVSGLNPQKTFNIHPALLSYKHGVFGGPGMYGHKVHEAVHAACARGEIHESGLTMHFVTDEYDRGPIFFEYRVPITRDMSPEDIALKVNTAEHEWQPQVTELVVRGDISWDGVNKDTLRQYKP